MSSKDMEHEEALEKAMRSKIDNILTHLEFYLREELVGMVDERRRILEKVKNHCIKEGFIE